MRTTTFVPWAATLLLLASGCSDGAGANDDGGTNLGQDGGFPPGQDGGFPPGQDGAAPDSGVPEIPVSPGGPAIFFTDLASGPRKGNTDTSKGQTAGVDGAYVSIWGKNLGATQGTSTVTVGGVAARVVYWGPANHGANLATRMGMQLVEVQIPGAAPLGPVKLQLTVNGKPSNTLTFTTRDTGAIRFVGPAGADANDGSFAKPWATFDKALANTKNGDVVYLLDGFKDVKGQSDGGFIGLAVSGTRDLPRALVAYPGAVATVGGTACEPTGHGLIHNFSGAEDGLSSNWVIAKLTVTSPTTCQQDTAVSLGDGYRMIANYVSNPRTSDGCQSGSVQCGGLSTCGSDLYILGNEMAFVQTTNAATGSKQCHGFYISGNREQNGTETNREIGWNYIHDNSTNRAINIYNESYNGASAPRAQIEGHRIHDNWMENQRGIGVLLGQDVTGENWLFNNVFVNSGLGPVFVDGGGFFILQLTAGSSVQPSKKTTLHVANNTIYGASFLQGPDYARGLIAYDPAHAALDFVNNVVVSTQQGIPYLGSDTKTLPNQSNLWFGAGAPPPGSTTSSNVDPKFVSGSAANFHLAPYSAAKAAGVAVPWIALDFDGIPRASKPSMGAYE
jgi:hypothetical protein